MAQLLDVVPPLPPHAGALPILNWETHLVRGALLWALLLRVWSRGQPA